MKKKIILSGIIVILLAAAGWFLMLKGESKEENIYKFATITRGNLSTVISSSGTLEAISTIDVGTQVSGTISRILVDFNTTVKKGQLLAILDTTTLAVSVRDAAASLMRAEALYEEAKAKYDRDKELFGKKFLSELDFISSRTNLRSNLASLQSARTALERAKTNLSYAFIHSPIDGRIINRNVEPGQTVAASFSTPTLFSIAADLTKMQILASVDESDIGSIRTGQLVKFTVQAYPDQKFTGRVEQIRLSPKTEQNVVNYTVVVKAANSELKLLPGMTATVDFYIEEKDDVLMLPNTALRFKPTAEMMDEIQKNMEKNRMSMPDSIRKKLDRVKNMSSQGGPGGPGGGPGGPGGGPGGASGSTSKTQQTSVMVWYLGENGLNMEPVRTGSTDGKNTEILGHTRLREGSRIIISAKGTELSGGMPTMNFGFGSKKN